MKMGVPVSLRVTVPLILLAFAATLSTVNLLHHVPQAEREADEYCRKHLTQEISRLQSTLEYLLLKGDVESAQHEIAVLAHNHDYLLAALTDERQVVIAPRAKRQPGGRGRMHQPPQKRFEPIGGQPRSASTSIVIATPMWISTPPQIDFVRIASVPRMMPAPIAPSVSGIGFWKWIMQYGTTMMKIAFEPHARRRPLRMKPRKKNSSDTNCAAYSASHDHRSKPLRFASR